MNRTKYLKGPCQHCRGNLEFPADTIGTVVPCPHCGQQTELMLARPPEEPTVPGRAIAWTVTAVIILGLGLAAALVALKRAEKLADRKRGAVAVSAPSKIEGSPAGGAGGSSEPAASNGFSVSAIALEKAPGTSLVYAVGTVKNTAARQRFGVKVELDLLDAADQKIGMATDYQSVLEPGAQWRFKALVMDSKAASAKLAALKEDQ